MMPHKGSELRVNDERFRASFEALAAIGAMPDGGVHRPAFSQAHLQARRWFLEQVQQAGLEARVDGAGNHSALLHCGPAGGPTLLLGSHLDSVPYGGRFDGALGVAAASEVLLAVKDAGISLGAHLEAVDFTDEEGHYVGLLGSLALAGKLEPGHLDDSPAGRERFRTALEAVGLDEDGLLTAGRDPASLAGYLELHIEQGLRLVDGGFDIGIVTSIVGIHSARIRFLGRADHAGTTPMERRLDAALGASAFALAVRECVMDQFPGCVATVGNMDFEPGASNVVPQAVLVSLEFRAQDEATLEAMEGALLEHARLEAERYGLALAVESLGSGSPARMDTRVQHACRQAAETLGLKHTFLHSGAGHDAQCLARICPAGMIFVPSVDGFSHSSREFTEWQDCVNGANVLLQAALLLAD
jgi:N-carbamoyl-L-amino-acid hydrolase